MSINKEVLFKTLEYTTSDTGTQFKVWEANSDQYAITTYIQGSNWSCSIDVDNNGRWKVNDAKETESNAVKFSHSNKALYISCSSSTSLISRIEIKYGTIKPVLPSVITSISGSLQTIPNGTSISKETVNDLNVTGNTNISSSFNVQGNTSVNANANLNSDLTVNGNTIVTNSANLNNGLSVNTGLTLVKNSATLNDGLNVANGLTTVNGSLGANLNKGLNVTEGLTTVNGSLGANLNKGLNVTESTFVGTTASLNGNLTVTQDTSVSADANLNSNLVVGGNTNVAQIANLNSNLTVFGNTKVSLNANLNSDLTVIGNTSVGTSTKSANAQLDGDLFVTGTTNVKTCASFCHGILVEGPVVINGIYDDSDPDKYSAIFNKGVNTSNALVTGNLNTTNLTVSQNVDVSGSLNIGPNSSLNINQIYTTSDNLTIGTSLPVGDNSALSVFIKDGKYYYKNDAGANIEITESTYNELKDKFTLKIDGNLYTNNIIVQGTQIASGLATNLQKNNANSNILYQKAANETELAAGLIYNDTNSELTTLQIQQPKQTNSNNGIIVTARSDNSSSIELKYNNSTPLILEVDNAGNSFVQSTCFNGKINNSETADTIVTTVTGSNSTYFIPFVSSSAAVSTGATMYVGGSAYNIKFNPSLGELYSYSINADLAHFDDAIITTNLELDDANATLDVSGSQSRVTFNGMLSVNSTANLNGNTNVAKDLTVTGNTNVYKDLTVCGNLIVKGNTTTVNTTELSIKDTFLELGKEDDQIVSSAVGFFTRLQSDKTAVLALNGGYGYIGAQSSSSPHENIVTDENTIITEGNITSSHDTITINDNKDLIINNVQQALALVKLNASQYEKYNVGTSNGTLIYFNKGIPTEQTGSIGSSNQLVYLSKGVLTAGNTLPVIPSLSIDSTGTGSFITGISNNDHSITITKSTPDEIYKISAVATITDTPYRVLLFDSDKTYPRYTEFISYIENENGSKPQINIGNNILTENNITALTFTGDLVGNAATATTANNATSLNGKAESALRVSHASTATQAASLGTNAGYSSWPVYFNNGKPAKIEPINYNDTELNRESHTESVLLFNDDTTKGFGIHSKLYLTTVPESYIRLELIKKDDTTPSHIKADVFDGTANNAVSLNGKAESALRVSHASTAGNATLLGGKAESELEVSHASTAHILVASSNMAGISVGSSTHPIYFNNGNPQPCDSTISLNISGTAAIARAVYCTSTSTNNNYPLVLSYSNNDSSNINKELRHTYNDLVYNPVEYKLIMTGNNLITTNKHGMALPKLSIQANIYDTGDPSEIGHAPKGQFIISTEESDNSDNLLFRCDSVEFSNSVTANSFNANSDKRLKTNIKEISDSISATDILNKTNIYTFNYLNNMTEKSIGVIAQELEDIDIDGFKPVNQDEKGYLSIKESKLIYLLIQGFKEQVKEIETLKEEIKKLKEKQGE